MRLGRPSYGLRIFSYDESRCQDLAGKQRPAMLTANNPRTGGFTRSVSTINQVEPGEVVQGSSPAGVLEYPMVLDGIPIC